MKVIKSGQISTLDTLNHRGFIYCPSTKEYVHFDTAALRSQVKCQDWVTFTYSPTFFGNSSAEDIFLDARPPCALYKVDFRFKQYFKVNSLGTCEGVKDIKCKS